jgi:hypothetical protein
MRVVEAVENYGKLLRALDSVDRINADDIYTRSAQFCDPSIAPILSRAFFKCLPQVRSDMIEQVALAKAALDQAEAAAARGEAEPGGKPDPRPPSTPIGRHRRRVQLVTDHA